ncbi:MAG: helix-turn-helix transcriptional regulator [Deltaproteobacteria bacterium]|jgi:transcriptional regulator with XRE-family HTH domain|nr:helix-turn-helix transcriptional regulator [Deltaproteobacteria bacterium]
MSSKNINKIQIFGKQLKILMQELNIRQRALAELAGMNESNISRLAGGTSTPTLKFILLLVENYEVSLNWLILNEGPMLLKDISAGAEQDELLTRRLLNLEGVMDGFLEDIDQIKKHLDLR